MHTIALLPTAYLKNNAETYFEILRRVDDGYDKFVRRSLKLEPFLRPAEEISYRRSNPVASWPNVESYMVQKEVGDPELLDKNFWIGGNFEIKIPIRQKHKVKYLGSASGRDHGFVNVCNIDSFTIGALKPLLNIYNEDQRSNRT